VQTCNLYLVTGGLVLSGGLLGFVFSRNPATLTTGVLYGGALLALSIFSLKIWRQGKSSLPFILGQAGSDLISLMTFWFLQYLLLVLDLSYRFTSLFRRSSYPNYLCTFKICSTVGASSLEELSGIFIGSTSSRKFLLLIVRLIRSF
jgi:hypothetical protein